MSPPLTKPPMFAAASKPPPPLCTFLFLLLLCILAFYTVHRPIHKHPPPRDLQTALRFRRLFLSSASNSTLSEFLRRLTLHPHLAGTAPSLSAIHFVRSHFQDLNFETHTIEYSALLSYPTRSSLTAHFANGTVFDFPLVEGSDKVGPDVVRPYHAYSPSGTAHAKVVFANRGREEDYRALAALGVNVTGCVVLVRKGGGLGRGGVVRIAESKGALAVLVYTKGDRTRGGAGGVERGTVMMGVGDPLTPGWAAVEGGERLGLEESEVLKRFPKIPSMPLSSENADVILGSLGGALAPPEWRREHGDSWVGRVGPGPTVVNFTYEVGDFALFL